MTNQDQDKELDELREILDKAVNWIKYPVTGGFILISVEDVELVSQHRWHISSSGYAVRKPYDKVTKKPYNVNLHRVINQTPDHLVTDHINHNRLDNRRENLRSTTPAENAKNHQYIRYGMSLINYNKTHCRNGHEYSENNIYYYKNERICKICHYATERRYKLKKRLERV